MDTTEELNGTYFYAGRPNLKANELLFMIFCEEFAEQVGVDDFAAIAAIVSGLNILSTRGKFAGATPGTSIASRGARRVFPKAKFPWGVELPTVIGGYPPRTLRVIMTHRVSTFIGRAIPVVGWVLLSKDVAQITYRTITHYNSVARGTDKIW
ncbi:membrane protein [Erwinia typographi]|uniref:Membrane protein n=1 Tax=Erwinia typographi TaxID=371042 RepID=A0A0A4ACR5_9GAMM|nr:hypothetical protein [Erwinia typographi]KGT95648.1 membrane protein [Erwinia typographi]